jgi:oligoendopeptidase F
MLFIFLYDFNLPVNALTGSFPSPISIDMNEHRIPLRSEVDRQNTWDLSSLYPSDGDWEKGLAEYETMAGRIPSFRGTLGKSAEALADYLDFARDFNILEERLGVYASLRQTEDEGDGAGRTMSGR